MIHKTRGVVLRFTRYGETSIIVNMFTEAFGVQSYIVNSVRSPTKTEMALFQPLTLLEMVVYHKEGGRVMRIKEKRCFYSYRSLYSDMKKATIAMFLNEILVKTLKEETHPSRLFEFISQALVLLDEADRDFESFHLIFLIRLAAYLGFEIEDASQLDLEGQMEMTEREILSEYIHSDYLSPVPVTTEQRRSLLNRLIGFYNEHIHHLGEMKSLQVLRDTLS